ncbi:ankyrin repeat-containing domain protein [Scenedesmus sp. NREL 46B-D3]|nr:ankyrin repeat-containing domain protein [Scenedesmus sp. NREL 46B-D3]
MGNTASAYACASGSSAQARVVDPGKELLRSAEQGEASIVAWILASDAHYLSHSSVFGGNSVWHKAAKAGRVQVLEAVERVVQQQFTVSCKDAHQLVAPYRLARLGSSAAEVIARLVNKANLKGVTPLMLACAGGHTDAVAWLLKHGADVWRHDRVRRHTALHCAAQAGATDAVRLLLASTGNTAHPTTGKRLVEMGNHAGLTALHYAVHCEELEVVQQLLAADSDITVQAEFPDLDWGTVNAGDTVMHIAAAKGNIDCIQLLLRAYNEKSGSLIPDSGLPRRLRDPRGMRNDYGRLPYHLAMRKGFTWLAELLDPSVPVRYLLVGEELGTDTTWGPPRLATIAASMLHKTLVADLTAIKSLVQAEEEAAAAAAPAAAGTAAEAAAPPAAAVTPRAARAHAIAPSGAEAAGQQVSSSTQSAEADASAAAAAGAGEDGSSDMATQRRCWSIMHRRSSSFGTGGRPGSRAGAAMESSSRPPSRRHGHSRRGSRTAGEFGPPPSPLSPRVLMSVMLGGAGLEQAGGDQGQDSAALSPKPHLDDALSLLECGLQLPPCLSPRSYKAAGAGAGADAEPAAEQQHQGTPSPAASGSLLTVADLDTAGRDWEGGVSLSPPPCASPRAPAVAIGEAGQQQEQQQRQRGGCSDAEVRTSMLEALLQQHRWSSAASAAALPGAGAAGAGSLGEDGCTCGVCLDATPTACILPCKHNMCADCAMDMCERFSISTAVCPFCRCIIRGFAPTNLPHLAAAAAPAAAAAAAAAVQPATPAC